MWPPTVLNLCVSCHVSSVPILWYRLGILIQPSQWNGGFPSWFLIIINCHCLMMNFFSLEAPVENGLGSVRLSPGFFIRKKASLFVIPEAASPQASMDTQIAFITQPLDTSFTTVDNGVLTAFATSKFPCVASGETPRSTTFFILFMTGLKKALGLL